MFVCCMEQVAGGAPLGPASMTVRAQTRKRKGARPRWGSRDRRGWAVKRAVGLSCRLYDIAADSQVFCSLWSALLLVSTFWPKPDVPSAEQQAAVHCFDVVAFVEAQAGLGP